MTSMIDNVDFHNLPVQKYWTAPSSWTPERKNKKCRMQFFRVIILAQEKWTALFINL